MPHKKGPSNLPPSLPAEALEKCSSTPDDTRPVLYFLAGPNGSGKSTIFELLSERAAPVPFINADLIAKVIGTAPSPEELAQKIASVMRSHYLESSTTFATETVFSDPVGDKIAYLREAERCGYRVVLIAAWIPSAAASTARVRMRVMNGGHGVPFNKLPRRYMGCMANLRAALQFVETAIVLDNSGPLEQGPQLKAIVEKGTVTWADTNLPRGIAELLPTPG